MLHRTTSLGHHQRPNKKTITTITTTSEHNNHNSNGQLSPAAINGHSSKKKQSAIWLIRPRQPSSQQQQHGIMMSCFVTGVLFLLLSWFWFLSGLIEDLRNHTTSTSHGIRLWRKPKKNLSENSSFHHCQFFRRYPNHRYYHFLFSHLPTTTSTNSFPDFLIDTEYIYGAWPVLLPQLNNVLTKVCVDQREWWRTTTAIQQQRWPFADGTNPSILSMDRVPTSVAKNIQTHYPTVEYIVTVCMTNSQCMWKDEDLLNNQQEDATNFDLPDNVQQKQPDTVRTILQFLDARFQVLAETTMYLKRDAPWGKKLRRPDDALHIPALDDARLFVHKSQIYVSFREGPGFGYEAQVLNPIHFLWKNELLLHAEIWASESSSFCCGRNMALLEDFTIHHDDTMEENHKNPIQQQLYALTWVDPVTVEKVDTTPNEKRQGTNQKPKQPLRTETQQKHRKLTAAAATTAVHKSHIHGTNGFMVPVPNEPGVYLGVAHFHRPNDRKPNEYARFGHHYTHAFYTVRPASSSSDSSTLVSLSPEFVLPSFHEPDDAEIIQFVSGLEIINVRGDDDDESTPVVILAYGINDCEAAITTIDWEAVNQFLRPVPAGKQVVDFMKKATPPSSSYRKKSTR